MASSDIEGLQQEFKNNGIELSQNVIISIQVEDDEWLITDNGTRQTYAVSREADGLNVYGFKFPSDLDNDNRVLFDIGVKYQSDLDNSNISENLQRTSENNGISLSQNVTISIEKQGSR